MNDRPVSLAQPIYWRASTPLALIPSLMVKVRLVRKHAAVIDDVDLRGHEPGDVLDLPEREAGLLLAEQWAIPERRETRAPTQERRRADDRPPHGRDVAPSRLS